MKPSDKPKCPKSGCKGRGIEQGRSGIFVCNRCNGHFDNEPNEGGDFSDKDPSARLQRQERQRKR